MVDRPSYCRSRADMLPFCRQRIFRRRAGTSGGEAATATSTVAAVAQVHLFCFTDFYSETRKDLTFTIRTKTNLTADGRTSFVNLRLNISENIIHI